MEILTGNELTSGAAVYLGWDGRWIQDLQAARLFGPDEVEQRDNAIAATKNTLRIVGVEIEAVVIAGGTIVPERLRERIRSGGPTAPAQDRQHLDEDSHVSI